MTLTEKVAFIKGLIEGSELKLEKKEARIFELLVDLLDDMANTVTELDDDVSVLYDDVEDLAGEIEEIGMALCDMDDCECCEHGDEDFMYEIECEKCGEKIVVDEEELLSEQTLRCPSCGEVIELEFDCDCEDCDDDCDCGHDHK